MKEARWWTSAEIEASGEVIFPVWLAEWIIPESFDFAKASSNIQEDERGC